MAGSVPLTKLAFSKFYPETALRMVIDVPLADNLVTNAMENSVILTGTTSATIGTAVAVPHGLTTIPAWVNLAALGSGVLYFEPQGNGLGWDETNIYVVATVASLDFLAKVEV